MRLIEPPGVTHRHVTVDDGCRIHVAEAGTGAPLVLLHGWPQHWYAWRDVIGPLAERFRVICPDLRGLGWSDAAGTDWSLRRLARDVTGVMDALGIDRCGVVGHDWGAVIGYRLALEQPGRVTRLMPMAAPHPWASLGAHPRQVWRPWHVYTAALLGRANNTWLQVPRTCLRTWRRIGAFTPDEEEAYCAVMRRPDARRATARYNRNLIVREVPYFVANARRLTLTLPILHLNGAEDPLTQRLSPAYRTYAPAMRLRDLPGCGHYIAEERTTALIDAVTTFFEPPATPGDPT
ncbi:alpha/beta fold hydrolase [Actinomadura nitritigenes]|uniref:alpha/beta fold hydrolase n=1 Tax=Actinomadura nitritigenes TaxID=134602 RepID=UPI003D8DADFF